jgi:hypothetical protein
VSGFGGRNHEDTAEYIDLTSVTFTSGAIGSSYTPNASHPTSGGVLQVTSGGTVVADINLVGNYTFMNFDITSGTSGTVMITDPPVDTANHTIANGATVTIATAAMGTDTFAGNSGTLALDDATAFSGKISGFGARDRIDLADIGFGANSTLGYAANGGNGGTLAVSDGSHTANLALLGNYMASTFVAASDGHGGTLIAEASQTAQQPLLTAPQHA